MQNNSKDQKTASENAQAPKTPAAKSNAEDLPKVLMKGNLCLIESLPQVQDGRPCFAGTAVPVQSFFDHLQEDNTISEFLNAHPSISRGTLEEVMQIAGNRMPYDSAILQSVGVPLGEKALKFFEEAAQATDMTSEEVMIIALRKIAAEGKRPTIVWE